MFSETISLKCRHLREARKNKNGAVSKSIANKNNQSKSICKERQKEKSKTVPSTECDTSENDKEDDEHF